MTFPSGLDLVVCSLESWDDVWRRNQFLIAGLLRRDPHLRVLFVEPPEDPAYLVKLHMTPRLGKRLRMITDVPGIGPDRLWTYQPTKWLPRSIGGSVDDRLARAAVRAAHRLKLSEPILWINNPTAAALLLRTGWPTVYDITDDWLAADRSDREHDLLVDTEAVLMARSVAVTVCSPGLLASKGTKRQVRLVPNAVDVHRYRTPKPRPQDLPSGKVALYVGTVHSDRIDAALCLRTAEHLTRAGCGTLVFVGSYQLGSNQRQRFAEAGSLVLGSRPNTQVPAYLQHADVLVVPHVVTEFTASLDPIKLYEYLAVGRPIVSTAVAGFADRSDVLIASADDFPSAVATELDRAPAFDPTIHVAGDVPDWSVRVADMAEVLAQVAASRRETD